MNFFSAHLPAPPTIAVVAALLALLFSLLLARFVRWLCHQQGGSLWATLGSVLKPLFYPDWPSWEPPDSYWWVSGLRVLSEMKAAEIDHNTRRYIVLEMPSDTSRGVWLMPVLTRVFVKLGFRYYPIQSTPPSFASSDDPVPQSRPVLLLPPSLSTQLGNREIATIAIRQQDFGAGNYLALPIDSDIPRTILQGSEQTYSVGLLLPKDVFHK